MNVETADVSVLVNALKPEGDVFVAGSDSAQQLLALCHAA